MAVDMRRLRLRAVWLLILPFLWLARPTPLLLAVGAVLGTCGLLIRGWAAGTIHKEEDLTTSGPYAYTRNPLYVGSFLLGVGVTVAGGLWYFAVLFVLFYLGVYGKTMRGEARLLTELFGDRYRHYAARVPAFVPRLTPYRPSESGHTPAGFRFSQYKRNREWEAALGAVAGFAFLVGKWWLRAR